MGVLLLALGGFVPAAAAQATAEGGATGADAPAEAELRPAIALFEGRAIDLTEGWDEARACMVWRQAGVLECFRTPEELDARQAAVLSARDGGGGGQDGGGVSASYSCGSPLRLYDYTYYGGRVLSFYDRGYWQNLWDYGFDDRTSSYAVGGCYVHLAEYAGGLGWWYPGPTYPWAGVPVMDYGWSNVISSLYIE